MHHSLLMQPIDGPSVSLVIGCCRCTCGQCGVPQVIAFSGKRQWSELINIGKRGKARVTNIPTGLQPTDLRPPVRHQFKIFDQEDSDASAHRHQYGRMLKPNILQVLHEMPGDGCYACRAGRCQQVRTSGS